MKLLLAESNPSWARVATEKKKNRGKGDLERAGEQGSFWARGGKKKRGKKTENLDSGKTKNWGADI